MFLNCHRRVIFCLLWFLSMLILFILFLCYIWKYTVCKKHFVTFTDNRVRVSNYYKQSKLNAKKKKSPKDLNWFAPCQKISFCLNVFLSQFLFLGVHTLYSFSTWTSSSWYLQRSKVIPLEVMNAVMLLFTARELGHQHSCSQPHLLSLWMQEEQHWGVFCCLVFSLTETGMDKLWQSNQIKQVYIYRGRAEFKWFASVYTQHVMFCVSGPKNA